MSETSASLLERVRGAGDAESWQRLVDVYTPLIRNWLRRQQLIPSEHDDVIQEVLSIIVRKIPTFEHNGRPGAFRAWLRAITVNCLRDFWRSKKAPALPNDSDVLSRLAELEDPASNMSRLWDEEHDRAVTRRLLELLKPRFKPQTWQAFQRVSLEGADPDAVAAELGITVNAVFIAKSRVMTLLRQEGAGLLLEEP